LIPIYPNVIVRGFFVYDDEKFFIRVLKFSINEPVFN
jgi:hypothetical protein